MQQNRNTGPSHPLPELTDAFQPDEFGTPISIGGRRGGRPKGVSLGQTVVPDRIVVWLVLHRVKEDYPAP